MIVIKNTYNNGIFEVEEIYSNTNKKIRENETFWNTSEDNPITIAKSRHNDYIETEIDCDNESKEEVVEEIIEP